MDVTDATFQAEVLDRSAQGPVVVDLWAPWCGPCTQLGPILEKVVGETGGRVVLAKLNVDENPAITARYGIRAMPTVLGFRDGTLQGKVVGAQARPEFEALVQLLL